MKQNHLLIALIGALLFSQLQFVVAQTYPVLQIGTNTIATIPYLGEDVDSFDTFASANSLYQFIPEDGCATIKSNGVNCYISLFNQEHSYLGSYGNSDGGIDCTIYEIEYMTPVFFGISSFGEEFNNVKLNIISSHNGVHAPIMIPEQEATCQADGLSAYYECEKCGSVFSDQNCSEPIRFWFYLGIPALGHDMGNNHKCTRCGLSAKTLDVGTTTINIASGDINPNSGDLADFGQNLYYFKAIANGSFQIISETEGSYLYIFNSAGSILSERGPNSNDDPISIVAGETYFVGFRSNNQDNTAIDNCPIHVMMPHTGGHQLIHYFAKEASCTEQGNCEYWYCDYCGNYFATQNSYVEGWTPFVGPLGHSIGNGGKCTRCDFSTTMLQIGDTPVTVDYFDINNFDEADDPLYSFKANRAGELSLQLENGMQFELWDITNNNYEECYHTQIRDVEEGQILYIKVGSHHRDDTGQKTFHIHYVSHSGDCVLVNQPAIAATCTRNGYLDCQVCTLCGQTYDANGHLWAEGLIPLLGHSMKDGQCQHGCGLTATELTLFGGTINVPSCDIVIESWDDHCNTLYYFVAPRDLNGFSFGGDNLWTVSFSNKQQYGYEGPIAQGETLFLGISANMGIGGENIHYDLYYNHNGGHAAFRHVEAQESSCSTHGTIEHFLCCCGERFTDEACTLQEQTYETPLKNHVYDTEGKCTQCDHTVPMLQLGDNAVTVNFFDPEDYNEADDPLYGFKAELDGQLVLQLEQDMNFELWEPNKYLSDQRSPATFEVEAGQILFFKVGSHHCDNTGDKTFHIHYSQHSGDCVLTDQPAVDATCVLQGYQACQICTLCGKTYDANGNEWTEARTPALGHSMKDGQCQHGCGLTAIELDLFGGTIDVARCDIMMESWDDHRYTLYYFVAPRDLNGYSFDGEELWAVPFSNKQQYGYDGPIAKGETLFLGISSHMGLGGKNCQYELYFNHDGDHTNYRYVEAQDVSCSTSGNNAYYQCCCGTRFSDESLTETCDEFYIPPYGHDIHDGQCSRCNMHYPELKLGHQTIDIAASTSEDSYQFDSYLDGNIYYLTAPVDGTLTITNEGSDVMITTIFDTKQTMVSNNQGGSAEYSVEQGNVIFIGFKNQDQTSESAHPIFLYMPQEGDLNHDGLFTIEDVTLLVNRVLQTQTSATSEPNK